MSHVTRRRSLAVAASTALLLAPIGPAGPFGNLGAAEAKVGVDDYPSYLKRAVQDGVADPWNFWNRECTSFVAWRLNNDRKVGFHNYFLGPRWSHAYYWADVARRLGIQVNDAAARGSVAWWDRNSPGSTPGHVAYVIAAGAGWVKVEEYNYATRGGYGQRTLFRGTPSYPQAFIHLKPIRFAALEKPTLEGTTQVGQPLVADGGSWWPTSITPELSYVWYADGRRIPEAEGRRLRLPGEAVGTRITVKTFARRSDIRTGVAESTRTTRVKKGELTLRRAPAVVGSPEVGVPLTAVTGVTRPAAEPALQWYVDGAAVPGATGDTYTPRPEDLDKPITAGVRQELLGYKPLATTSEPSARVAPGTLEQTAPPTLPDDPRVGARLRVDPGGWPRGTEFTFQWLAGGTPIEGATRRRYTPKVEQLGKALTVRVTASKTGYRTATATTAAGSPVALGTLVSRTAPEISGSPKVGKAVAVTTGRWTKDPTFAVQWLSDGVDIPGATGLEHTPTPAQVHTRLSARITASQPGYRDAVAYASALSATARGDVARKARPAIEGTAWVGQTLTSTLGAWSVEPDAVRYRWLADGLPISGANAPTLALTPALVGAKVVIEQRVTAAGYKPITSLSRPVVPTRGEIAWTRTPAVTGATIAGKTLTASPGTTGARGVDTSYRWLRDGEPIAGATRSTYTLTPDDVGHRVSARVRATAKDWDAAEVEVSAGRRVRASSVVSPKVAVDGRRATLTVRVSTPGRRTVGTITVLLDGKAKATKSVAGEPVTVRLGRLSSGSHTVRVKFTGEGATNASEKKTFRVGR